MRLLGILAAIAQWSMAMKALILRFIRQDSGASSIEYAMIAAAIAAVVVVSVNSLGTKVEENYTTVATALNQE
jgi:pilus assembly protein Flp/PilA